MKQTTPKERELSLTENQIYIIQGFLYDYDTIASTRVADYLQKRLDETTQPQPHTGEGR